MVQSAGHPVRRSPRSLVLTSAQQHDQELPLDRLLRLGRVSDRLALVAGRDAAALADAVRRPFRQHRLIVQRRRLAAHGARSQHARSARAHAQLDQHGLLDRAADARRYSGGRGSAAVHDRRPCDGSGRFADPCRSQNALTGLTTGRTRCVRRAMCARTHRLSNTPSASSSGPSCKSGRNSSSPRAATPTGSGGSTGAASGESCVRHLCVMLTGA